MPCWACCALHACCVTLGMRAERAVLCCAATPQVWGTCAVTCSTPAFRTASHCPCCTIPHCTDALCNSSSQQRLKVITRWHANARSRVSPWQQLLLCPTDSLHHTTAASLLAGYAGNNASATHRSHLSTRRVCRQGCTPRANDHSSTTWMAHMESRPRTPPPTHLFDIQVHATTQGSAAALACPTLIVTTPHPHPTPPPHFFSSADIANCPLANSRSHVPSPYHVLFTEAGIT